MIEELEQMIEAVLPEIKEIRHQIHANPEIGFKEYETSKLVRDYLNGLGLNVQGPFAETGVTAFLSGGDSGKVIGLRAEMDALPMEERSQAPYASKRKGFMHACGHDGHTAILLGTAKILSENRDQLKGGVKFIFQPAEEGYGGGKKMVEEGVLENPHVDSIFALHGWPKLDLGNIGIKYGIDLASTDDFRIVVQGKGTHGASPHLGVDPIVIASRIVEAIQSIPSRMNDPLEPLVITVGMIRGGTGRNIIPESVVMEGTIRTLSAGLRAEIPGQMERLVKNIAEASGGTGKFELLTGYPVTTNDDNMVDFVINVAKRVIGEDRITIIERPVMGGEDFSFYLEKIPGAIFRLGVGLDMPSLHSTTYDFNDDAIKSGIFIMSSLAVEYLQGF